jgi:hypothetical protein
MASLTLYDLAVLQRNDPYTGLIEDVTTLAPEFSTFAAHKRPGTWYEIVSRTTLPTAQFRPVNQGVTSSKSTYKKAVKEMLFIDTQLQVDEAVWDGSDGTIGSIWQLEAEGAVRSSSILIGQQTWYGTSADSYGFKGIASELSYVVKAGGTTNTTSAYLVWEDEREGVRYDVGMDGSFAISPPFRQQIVDVNNAGKTLFAYVGNLKSYVGLFVGSAYSCWGITGITTNTAAPTTNGITDNVAFQLLGYIPAARRNKLRWFMNRSTEAILRQNRSTVATTGAVAYQPADSGGMPAYAPLPERLAGWPITITDSILNTETNS